jgi:hypothetical protein
MRVNYPISKKWWNSFLALGVTLVLDLLLIGFPVPPGPGVDASKALVFVHAYKANLQFGSEIVFTYGPWGFLVSTYSFHGTLWLKVLWETAGKLALAITFVLLGRNFSLPRRLLFYASVIVAAAIFSETILLMCATLVSLIWLLGRESKRWELALAIAWLSLLSQIKFSYCILAAIAVALASSQSGLHRHWKRASAIVTGYVAGFLLLWIAAGQSIANLPMYLYRSSLISDGYWNAVALNEIPAAAWWTAITIGFCVLAFVVSISRVAIDRLWIGFVLAYFSIVWFLTWKHGFTRADSAHAVTFFLHALVFALVAPVCFTATRWCSPLNFVPILSLLGLYLVDQQALPRVPANLWDRLNNAPREILWFRDRERNMADAELQDANEESHSDLRRLVQGDTIDVVTWEQSEVFRSGLNYQPRPVFQSYLTFSRPLAELNLRFYQGDRAPRFVFARIEAIDSRLLAQEDSLLLEELPRRYSIAAEKADYVLLERKTEQPTQRDQPRECTPVRRVRLDEEITLPTDRDVALELRAVFKPTVYGLMRTFLIQPALLRVIVTDEQGQKYSYRVVPSMAETGFVVKPFLESQKDFAALFGGCPLRTIRSIRFEASPSGCWSTVEIQFCWLTELPLQTSAVGQSPP